MTAQDNPEFDLLLFWVSRRPWLGCGLRGKARFSFQINAIPPVPVLLRKYSASPLLKLSLPQFLNFGNLT
jgi:hypothetical protein